MSTQYTVTALDRRGMGHPTYSTPGRSWPSGQPVTVEVLDQDADPMLIRVVDGQDRPYPDPHRIGQKAWKRICSDGKLTIRPVGENAQDVQSLATRLSDAVKLAAESAARTAEAEAKVRILETGNSTVNEKAQAEIARLQGVIERQNEALDKAAGENKALASRVEGLADRNRELESQLDEATAPKQSMSKRMK